MTKLEQSGQLTSERIDLLAEIVGKPWLEDQLKQYARFREDNSPISRWWHRLPNVSPIIPLVFWAKPGPRLPLDTPYGVWRGDPSGILARFLAAIVEFRYDWDQLPGDMGRRHLRHTLQSPSLFFGMRHELRLATHLKGSGCEVEPLFLDPRSEKGGADIVVKDGNTIFDIQCKARNPIEATNLPYDEFQFLAGSWVRIVEDSGRSYFLFLDVKRRIDLPGMEKLISTLRDLVSDTTQSSMRISSDEWAAEIKEIGFAPGMMRPTDFKEIANRKGKHHLYNDIERIKEASQFPRSPPQIAGCHVTGNKRSSIEQFAFSIAETAAKAHSGKNPLIVSVNLYQDVDVQRYLNEPNVKSIFYKWKNKFFAENLQVAMVLFSANYERYLPVDGMNVALGTKYLAVDSPYWYGVLPSFNTPWDNE